MAPVVLEVRDGDADERDAPPLDHRRRRGEQFLRRCEDRVRLRRRLVERVRPRRAREVVEAQPQDDRAPDPPRRPQPARDPVDEPDQRRVELVGEVGRRPSARCDPIEPRRRPVRTGRGSRLCARACRWRPDADPSIDTSTDSGSNAT